MIKIEKGIAITPLVSKRGGKKYPFAQMEVGDSFFCAGEIKITNVISAVYHARLRDPELKNRKFSSRKQDGGVRVWRTK